MKTLFRSLFAFVISTPIVFAAPGMNTYSKSYEEVLTQREQEMLKLKEQKAESREELLKRLDKAIAKAETMNSKKDFQKFLDKSIAEFDKSMKTKAQEARLLLANPAKFTLAFNKMKLFGPEVTQYEFKKSLLEFLDPASVQEAREEMINSIHRAGSLASYLKDVKESIETGREDLLVKKDADKSRSIASIRTSLTAAGVLAIVTAGCLLLGIKAVLIVTGTLIGFGGVFALIILMVYSQRL